MTVTPNAPPFYQEGVWQQILGRLVSAIDGCFKKSQDVRLVNGERLSMKASDGTEVFFNVGPALLKVSSAATLTLADPGVYIFSGTTSTWTLPAVSGHANWRLLIKNRGSGDLTIQRAGSDQIYTSSAVTSLTVKAGASEWLICDGSFWCAMRPRAVFG